MQPDGTTIIRDADGKTIGKMDNYNDAEWATLDIKSKLQMLGRVKAMALASTVN